MAAFAKGERFPDSKQSFTPSPSANKGRKPKRGDAGQRGEPKGQASRAARGKKSDDSTTGQSASGRAVVVLTSGSFFQEFEKVAVGFAAEKAVKEFEHAQDLHQKMMQKQIEMQEMFEAKSYQFETSENER